MTAGPSEHIGFSVEGGIAVLEIRRPEKRNAVTGGMWEDMIRYLEDAGGDPDVRILVVQGAGGMFSAGADLAEVKNDDGTASAAYRELAHRAFTAIAAFPTPSIARIEGACIGGGCGLALACDLRFAHPNATFSIPAVRHGIVYNRQSLERLVALVGPSRASRLMFTAERIDAAEAERIGLVDERTTELDQAIAGFANAVAAGRRDTIAATRPLLRPAELLRAIGT